MDCLEALGDAVQRQRLHRKLITVQKAALLGNQADDARVLLIAAQVLGAASKETRWLAAYVADLCRDFEAGRRLFDELQSRGEDLTPVRHSLASCLRAVADPRWEFLANGLL